MTAKFKKYYQKMIEENKEDFDNFTKIHFEYSTDNEKYQEIFNQEGKKIIEIIHEYENRLCANTERGKFNKYSTSLAEKFQNEVRKHYPLIDHIGIIVKKFSLKKISLS